MKHAAIFLFILTTALSRAGAQNYITPSVVTTLSNEVEETSGLLNLGGELWTHNDSGDDYDLYQIDLNDGDVIRTVEVINAENVDWEDITQDETYVYIGDIGNNEGSRTDLKIYRVPKADIALYDDVEAEVISFYYSDQTSFEPNYHNTNFDCEALMYFDGYLYMFTKNWLDYKTNCYRIPASIGEHEAILHSGFDVSCLVTGATYVPATGMVVLIGYTTSGGSYSWLFSGFEGDDFFSQQQTKLIWTTLSQIEGVCDAGDNEIYVSSEKFAGFLDPTLYSLDLSAYTTGVENVTAPGLMFSMEMNNLVISAIDGKPLNGTLRIITLSGSLLHSVTMNGSSRVRVPTDGMKGFYIAVIEDQGRSLVRKILIP